jgi:hypothetical protein
MERCACCILPLTYPGITFDEQGICSFCRNFKKTELDKRKKRALIPLVEKARLNRGKYQAIVPISGGKDSSYVLYVMRRLYGLKVLAINYNNGFRSKAAEINLDTLTNQLAVDFISIKPNWNLMKKLYAAFVRITGEFCTVCNAMGYLTIISFILGVQKEISAWLLVVGGWSKDLEAMPDVYSFDFRYFYDIVSEAGLTEELRRSSLVSEECLDLLISMPDPRLMETDADFPIEWIMFHEYMSWDINHISRILKKETGWIVPSEAENETHFDCTMYPVAKYFERRKYGFSQSTVSLFTERTAGDIAGREHFEELAFPRTADVQRRIDSSQKCYQYNYSFKNGCTS